MFENAETEQVSVASNTDTAKKFYNDNREYYSAPKSDANSDTAINLNVTSKPMDEEIYIDVNHDGVNDFVVEDFPIKTPNEVNMKDQVSSNSDPIILNIKKKQ